MDDVIIHHGNILTVYTHVLLFVSVFCENVPVVELLTQLKVDPLQRDYECSLTALDYSVGQYANATIARIILKVKYPF